MPLPQGWRQPAAAAVAAGGAGRWREWFMETEAAAAAGGITAQELLDHQWRFRFKGDLDHERRSLELSARFRCAARNSGRSWPGISQSYFPVPWHAAQDKSRLGHSYLCGPPPCVAAHGTPSRPPSFLSFTFTFTSSPSPASSSSSSSLPSMGFQQLVMWSAGPTGRLSPTCPPHRPRGGRSSITSAASRATHLGR